MLLFFGFNPSKKGQDHFQYVLSESNGLHLVFFSGPLDEKSLLPLERFKNEITKKSGVDKVALCFKDVEFKDVSYFERLVKSIRAAYDRTPHFALHTNDSLFLEFLEKREELPRNVIYSSLEETIHAVTDLSDETRTEVQPIHLKIAA